MNNLYCDVKAKELLSKMTLEEKISQLGSIWSSGVIEDRNFSPGKAKKLIKNGIGQITRALLYSVYNRRGGSHVP